MTDTAGRYVYRDLPVVAVAPDGQYTVRMTEPCPWCGDRHRHGIEDYTEPSHRGAHCLDAEGDYYIVDAEESERSDEFVAMLARTDALLASARRVYGLPARTHTVIRVDSREEEVKDD